MRTLLALVLTLFAVDATAASWQQVVIKDEFSILIDVDSITTSGSTVRAWSKWQYNKPVPFGSGEPGKSFQVLLSLTSYKCADRSFADLQALAYSDREGTQLVANNKYPDSPELYEVALPESTGEQMLALVCKSALAGDRLSPRFSEERSPGGVFSFWHWLIVGLIILNLGSIVHIAVSNRTRSTQKALWVIAALIIPLFPYLAWLAFRPKAPTKETSHSTASGERRSDAL